MTTTTTTPAVRIKEVAFTGYPVTEMERARAFYEGLLGLKTSAVFEHGGRHWVEYDVGATTIALSNMSMEQWRPSADGPVVALEVENFDEAVAALRAGGAKFLLEPMGTGVCSMTVVADPDGNSVMIHRRND
jgi:Predicted enzyme related to lactoylglutathione lyase